MNELGTLLSLIAGSIVGDSAACVVAGLLVSEGRITFVFAMLGCFLGIVLGDIFWLSAGRVMGWGLIDKAFGRWGADSESLTRWRQWVQKHSVAAVFVSRFIPGLQTPLHILNGFLARDIVRLVPALFVAAAMYVALVLTIVTWLGEYLGFSIDSAYSLGLLIVVGILAWGLTALIGGLAYRFLSSRR